MKGELFETLLFLSEGSVRPHLMRQDLVVTKANSLIEASYRLNVSEQRAVALLAAQVQPEDEDFKDYQFKVSDLESLTRTKNGKAYAELKQLTRDLISRVITIQEPDGPLQISWLSGAKYFDGRGEVALSFDPKLKPYMLKLKEKFTSYKLANIIKLRSRYSVRLYELLKQYESAGKRTFELPELRKHLGLTNDEYLKWKDFRVNVLGPALRELPKKTDITFSYQTRKRGRAVHWLDFKIWCPQPQSVPKHRVRKLETEASKCWKGEGGYGNCRPSWAEFANKPNASCHWCRKFEKQRAEAAGQLPLLN